MSIKERQQRVEDWNNIQTAVIVHLSKKHLFGYPTHIITKEELETKLIPKVDKITNYIYRRQVDCVHFLNEIKDVDIWKIAH